MRKHPLFACIVVALQVILFNRFAAIVEIKLSMALEAIAREGCGVLVYLPQEGRGIGLAQKIRAYALQEQGLDTVEANHALGFKADMRDYGIGIQILKDLGLTEIRLLTNNPKKTEAFNLRGFDLTVVDQVPIIPPVNVHNAQYLATKREKMGHALPNPSAIDGAFIDQDSN